MAKFVVTDGAVTSWTGYASLVTGETAHFTADISNSAAPLDSTGFNSSGAVVETAMQGLSTWSANLSGRLAPTSRGDSSTLTWSGVTGTVRSWSLTCTNSVQPGAESTDANGVDWQEFLAGLWGLSGTIEVQVDSSSAAALTPDIASASLALTIKDSAGETQTFTFTAMLSASSKPMTVGQIARATYSFRNTGALTIGGTATNKVFDDITTTNALVTPAAGALTITDGNGSYAGDAIPSSIVITCAVDQLITVQVTAQGTGALDEPA